MAKGFREMNALIFGAIIGVAVIRLSAAIVPNRSQLLQARLSNFVPGFRFGRSTKSFDPITFALSIGRQIKSKLTERSVSKARKELILQQLPDFLELIAVAASAGESFYSALRITNDRAIGVLADEFERLLAAIEMGSSLEFELEALSGRIRIRQLEEFANKVILAQRRGAPIAKLMRDQAASIRAEIRNQLLAKAGQNETKMLIPLVFMILPVTVLFAIYPSLQLLNFDYA